jgi:glyoxylase-like metal-dependent hydrolase (beta-lactamase superfamily II)
MLGETALAKAPKVGTQPAYFYRFGLGDAEVTVVSDGPLPLGPPKGTFVGVPDDEVKKMLTDNFLSAENVVLEQNSPIVNTGDKLILFDTGMGTAKNFGPSTGRQQRSMKEAGIKPEDIDAVVFTHAHIDHIGGAAKLKALTGAPVYMNQNDAELYAHMDTQATWLGIPPPSTTEIDSEAREGDRLTLGTAGFHILHTPGHTQGSISIWIPAENKLIAGDTLFRDSIGRTDLPGGNPRQIIRSIHEKLLALPETAVVIPGHGQNTTIGREKERNPFLQGL